MKCESSQSDFLFCVTSCWLVPFDVAGSSDQLQNPCRRSVMSFRTIAAAEVIESMVRRLKSP